MEDGFEKFRRYICEKGLKSTRQREIILKAFLKSTSHLSTEDLYLSLRKKHPGIGYATVYRTLKLFAECGIAEEQNFGDGQTRFEPSHQENHHDHLVCTACHSIIEFENPQIEKLQEEVAANHGFTTTHHRLELYGLCQQCSS
ncbi:MAG: transcriptional repressor [Desulfuromonadaceae bacterium]|nr:transcriptional repressor [Desulfuromonadaceae bacterium]